MKQTNKHQKQKTQRMAVRRADPGEPAGRRKIRRGTRLQGLRSEENAETRTLFRLAAAVAQTKKQGAASWRFRTLLDSLVGFLPFSKGGGKEPPRLRLGFKWMRRW